MESFDYTAQCDSGAAISGTLEMADGEEAMKQLNSMGLRNVDLQKSRRAPVTRPLAGDDFIFFNEQLASLAESGICLDVGLRQLGKDIHSPRLRKVLDALATDLEQGQSLDDALEKHAGQMPGLYARVVRAGVASGQLPATLLNLSHHLRMVSETRRLIAEALTYPTIVLVLAFGVMSAIITLVIPQFKEIFTEFNMQLPALTLAVFTFSDVALPLLMGVGVITVIAAILFLSARATSGGRAVRERIVLSIPLVGSMICDSLRARFLRAMAFAVHSGLPLPEALRLSAGATASPGLVREADRTAAEVEQGRDLYDVSQNLRLIPAMFGFLVRVRADGASLRDALVQLSKAYESRAMHSQSMLRGWVAPVSIVLVGLVIAVLILSMFLPLISIINAVSG